MTDREILEKLMAGQQQLFEGQQQFDSRMQRVEEQLQRIEERTQCLEERTQRTEERTQRLEVLLENTLPKHIQLIAEQHGDIIKKLDALSDYPETRGRVATLEHVAKAHTKDISELKKAVG